MKKTADWFRKVMLPVVLMLTLIVSGFSFTLDVNASSSDNFGFTLTDINGKTVSTKNTGAKVKMIVFGRVGCGNTRYTLSDISRSDWVSDKQIEVMFIEEGNATSDEMKEFVSSCCCSDMVICPTENEYGTEIMWEYWHAYGDGSNSVTFPVIFFIDGSDKVRNVTTAAQSADELIRICSGISTLDGIDIPEPTNPVDVTVNVKCGQSAARAMLDEMNARRTGSNGTAPWCWSEDDKQKVSYAGRGKLVYDYDLEKVAMQRAAEIAISYSHTRPDGTSCSTAYSEVGSFGYAYASGENIAAGQRSAEEVLDAWWEEDEPYAGQGHRRNILDSDFGYVGIGHVVADGVDYWVQEFSSVPGSTAETAANNSKTDFTVRMFASDIMDDRVSSSVSSISIVKGSSKSLPDFTEEIRHSGTMWGGYTPVVNENKWTVENPGIAEISGGTITGKALGTTTISRKAAYGDDSVSITVTVKDSASEDTDDQGAQEIEKIDGSYKIPVTLTYGQTAARQLFDELNARRTGSVGTPWCWNEDASAKTDCSGRSALTYDYALEQVAMQRAAEVSLFYLNARESSHMRPDGTYSETAFAEVEDAGVPVFELFLTGDETVEAMIEEWWEENETTYDEQFERRVLLKENARYAGIGHAVRGGEHFWVIELASTGGVAAPVKAFDGDKTVNVLIHDSYVNSNYIDSDTDRIDLTVGESAAVPSCQEYISTQMNFAAPVPVNNNNEWVIADTSIADFSGGRIVAKKAGSTVLTRTTAVRKYNEEIPITVSEPGQSSDPADPSDPSDPSGPVYPSDPSDQDDEYYDLSKGEISLEYSSCTYNGSSRKPMVTVFDAEGYILYEGSDYTVAYSNNKNVGTAEVTVTGIGYYKGSLQASFRINPKKTSLKSVKPLKKGFTAKWKKQKTQVTGYQLQYSTSKSFKKGKQTKTVTITKAKTVTKKVKKLKAKKKYYVRIRTYKTVNGTKYYSAWSAKKTVKTK